MSSITFQNLETIPRLKDTIVEKDDEITELHQQLREKTALLSASRRTLVEYKDKIRVRTIFSLCGV